MAQQTAVEWLLSKLKEHTNPIASDSSSYSIRILKSDMVNAIEQAKEMEKAQRIKDYNVGYDDAQCNHINDAENYANEIKYIQSRIDEIDSEIKAKQNNIADMLINGDLNSK